MRGVVRVVWFHIPAPPSSIQPLSPAVPSSPKCGHGLTHSPTTSCAADYHRSFSIRGGMASSGTQKSWLYSVQIMTLISYALFCLSFTPFFLNLFSYTHRLLSWLACYLWLSWRWMFYSSLVFQWRARHKPGDKSSSFQFKIYAFLE